MINNSEFILKEIPNFHPIAERYEALEWWRNQKKMCVEGCWVGGKWCPGELYYYINFHNIKFETDEGATTAMGLPSLRDIEWEKAYIYSEATGFSGFADDTEYTCDRKYGPEKEKNLKYGWITQEQLDKFKYIDVREYLARPYSTNLGKPLYRNESKNVMDLEGRGGGKDLESNQLLIYEDGKKYPIKDVKIGDKIFGGDGKLTTVIQRKDFNDQLQYEVTFSDGRKVECGGGHLWTTYRRSTGRYIKEVKTLDEIRENLYYKRGENRYYIPVQNPLEYSCNNPDIDPYYLGLWLGDGNSHNTGITTMDNEIVDFLDKLRITENMKELNCNRKENNKAATYIITNGGKGGDGGYSNPLKNKLRDIGVLNNKHIPLSVLTASFDYRLAVLQGLMDSDGSADKTHVELSTSYKGIQNTILDLIGGLGIRYYSRIKKTSCKNSLRISLQTGLPLFRLKRKINNTNLNPSDGVLNRRIMVGIIKIEPTKVKPSVCIAVDNEDSLFLVNDYIVTHNSYWASACIAHNFLFDGARDYEEYMRRKRENIPYVSDTVVGAIDAKYSNDLLSKVKLGVENLPGKSSIISVLGETEYYPSPLYTNFSGSLMAGKSWTNTQGSVLNHRTFADNPLAANGTRPNRVFLEECFGKGTKIRMYDLSLRNIEDIKIGDRVLGTDGKPKVVGKIISGEDDMYLIEQKRGINYITNSEHLLYLEQRCFINGINDDGIKYIKSKDFNENNLGKYRLRTTYGKKSGLINFNKTPELKINPYYLGIWLGDGTVKKASVVVNIDKDIEIYNFIKEYAASLDMTISEGVSNTLQNDVYGLVNIINKNKSRKENIIRTWLKEYKIFDNKRIPIEYQYSSEENRLQLLAGLIDTDGNFSTNSTKTTKTYEMSVSKRKELAYDIVFLARSLGFDVHVKEKLTNIGYNNKIIESRIKYRISIKGEVWRIPCKIQRKKVDQWVKTNAINSTPIKVSKIGKDKYYGITLIAGQELDRLFLLEDNTIIHNCGFMNNIIESWGAIEATQAAAEGKRLTIYGLGTGGLTTGGAALYAQEIFYHPEAYNCLSFPDQWEDRGSGRKIGYFLPAEKTRNKFKEGINKITNVEKARESITEEIEAAKNSGSRIAYLSKVINNPRVPSDIFLRAEGVFFPIHELKECLADLERNTLLLNASYKVELRLVEGVVGMYPSEKKPIIEFPLTKGSTMDACIEIYEKPKKDAGGIVFPNRYYLSLDPVDDDGNSDVKRSLQSAHVMDMWTDRIVAEYSARTYLAEEFYENTRKLCLFYRARLLYENNKKGLYGHFKNKNSLHLLIETPEILKDQELVKFTGTGNRALGVNMSDRIKLYAINLLLSWLEKPSYGNPEKKNMTTIRSIALLKELIAFSLDVNADRVSSLLIMMILKQELGERATERVKGQTKTTNKDPFWGRAYSDFHSQNVYNQLRNLRESSGN